MSDLVRNAEDRFSHNEAHIESQDNLPVKSRSVFSRIIPIPRRPAITIATAIVFLG